MEVKARKGVKHRCVESEFKVPYRSTQCQHCLMGKLKRCEKDVDSSSAEGKIGAQLVEWASEGKGSGVRAAATGRPGVKRVQGSAGLRVRERKN